MEASRCCSKRMFLALKCKRAAPNGSRRHLLRTLSSSTSATKWSFGPMDCSSPPCTESRFCPHTITSTATRFRSLCIRRTRCSSRLFLANLFLLLQTKLATRKSWPLASTSDAAWMLRTNTNWLGFIRNSISAYICTMLAPLLSISKLHLYILLWQRLELSLQAGDSQAEPAIQFRFIYVFRNVLVLLNVFLHSLPGCDHVVVVVYRSKWFICTVKLFLPNKLSGYRSFASKFIYFFFGKFQ